MAREAMKKYKIALGLCGCHICYSNVISAHSEEEAVQKFLDMNNEEVTKERFDSLVKMTKIHVPKPRKKKSE